MMLSSRIILAVEVLNLARHMDAVASDMIGSDNDEIREHGRELRRASRQAQGWGQGMMGEVVP